MSKYNKLFNLTRFALSLFALSILILVLTAITIGQGKIIQLSMIFCTVSFILLLIALAISLIIKIISLSSSDRKKRLINALKFFLFASAVLLALDVLWKREDIDVIRIVSITFGSAVGTNFGDLIFFKRNNLTNL